MTIIRILTHTHILAMADEKTLQFIAAGSAKHNNFYDYRDTVYIRSKSKVIIICPDHGPFEQMPYAHLSGSGCPIHGGKGMNGDEFKRRAIEKFGGKFDYKNVVYKSMKSKVTIICKKHELQFLQSPDNHLRYSQGGCPECLKEFVSAEKLKPQEEFLKQAMKIFPDGRYDYTNTIYKAAKEKVTIVCKEHGPFNVTPDHHISRKQGCPRCNYCPSCQLWRTMGDLCEYCKPLSENKKYEKTKEMAVVKFLREMLPDEEFIHNKSVGSECTGGHLYPDILFDCLHYQLIVEVDEHKHRGASYQCEQKRMYDVVAKLGQKCIFIRYNPDSKESNLMVLYNTVHDYLHIDERDFDGICDELTGLKVEYLFY